MIETKVAVSKKDNRVVLLVDGKVQETILEDDEILVDLGDYNNFIKPKWNGSEWVEGATEEEIQEWKDNQSITIPLTEEQQRLLDLEMAIAAILGGGM